jgi:hypothetical protein
LLGTHQKHWQHSYGDGDFAIFRLTPDKYHYNHVPVSGMVVDFYAIGAVLLLDAPDLATQVSRGLHLLWNPGVILSCQILWIGIFLYMGRSQVTGTHISFHVRIDRI